MKLPAPALLPGYLTTAEAAERSGFSRDHIQYLCRRGAVNGFKIAPRLWLVETASLDEYTETEHKRGPKPKQK